MIFQIARLRRINHSFFLSAAFVLLTAIPTFAAKQDNVPDWVTAAASQTLPPYPPETNAVVLLDDTTYTVAPDGRATERCRVQRPGHCLPTPFTPRGRDLAHTQL